MGSDPTYLGYVYGKRHVVAVPKRLGALYVYASDYDVIAKEVAGCREEITWLRAALAHELSVLRESLHVLHCGGKTPECPTRERELAAIKRIEGVLNDGTS